MAQITTTPLTYLFKPVYDMSKGGYISLSAKRKVVKRDWADRFFGKKLSKGDKVLFKGAVYGAGALALVGAGGFIAGKFK